MLPSDFILFCTDFRGSKAKQPENKTQPPLCSTAEAALFSRSASCLCVWTFVLWKSSNSNGHSPGSFVLSIRQKHLRYTCAWFVILITFCLSFVIFIRWRLSEATFTLHLHRVSDFTPNPSGVEKWASWMQSRTKERMRKLKLRPSITISKYQTSDFTVSDHTARKTSKDERQKQRRWMSGAFQEVMATSRTCYCEISSLLPGSWIVSIASLSGAGPTFSTTLWRYLGDMSYNIYFFNRIRGPTFLHNIEMELR